MYESLAELIIQNEKSDYRFERYSLAAIGREEGVTFLPTSQSWDLARDGRATGRGRGSHANVLCATLNENLDAKSEADLTRLTALASPDRIAYCSSQKLSEERADLITASLRRHAPNGSIIVYGAKQLATLAAGDRQTFENFYGAEMQDIRSMIFSENPSGPASAGLRLALLTYGSAEGAMLRDEVLRATLLDRLSPTEPQSIQSISSSFSQDIGLQRVLPDVYLQAALRSAREAGLVERVSAGWLLTQEGAKVQAELPFRGAEQLLEGRQIIRASLERLIGKSFTNRQYAQLWSSFIDAASGIFHANGLEIIRGVNEILSGSPDKERPPNLRKELEKSLKGVVSVITTDELRGQALTGLLDLFTERDGPAFEWLTRVSERFVTLCALGLERQTGTALRETLTAQRVVLDSDIIIDYLCAAEPDHETSRDLLVNWMNIGGKILVSPIILEEVAHNAWISDRDFRATETLLGKLKKWELTRYIKNPFVRTYHSCERSPSRWQMFVGQYRGNAPGDYSKILALLRQRLKVELLPTSFDERLADRITNYVKRLPILTEPDEEYLEDVLYKVDRDGKLLATMAAARAIEQAAGFEDPMVLLSSSIALKAAEAKFESDFGGSQLVLNRRSFSYLLASVPQVSLGADTLRRALFAFGTHGKLKSDGLRAMRLIRATGEVEFAWAERVTLRKELSLCMRREADRRGITKRKMEALFMSNRDPDTTAHLVVEAAKALATPTRTQTELENARKRIKDLEEKLAEATRR